MAFCQNFSRPTGRSTVHFHKLSMGLGRSPGRSDSVIKKFLKVVSRLLSRPAPNRNIGCASRSIYRSIGGVSGRPVGRSSNVHKLYNPCQRIGRPLSQPSWPIIGYGRPTWAKKYFSDYFKNILYWFLRDIAKYRQ